MKLRKINALLLALVMVLSLSLSAFAAENSKTDSATGNATMGFTFATDVFNVEFPTVPIADTSVFNFTMDPQNVLATTQNAHYNDVNDYYEYYVYSPSTVYFHNYIDPLDDHNDYYDFYQTHQNYKKVLSDKSDAVTVVNKGGSQVSVAVTATASNFGNVKLVSTDNFDSDDYYKNNTCLYLALIDEGSNSAGVPIDAAKGGKITATIDARPNSYEVTYEQDSDKFYYSLKKDLEQDAFDAYSYSFRLTGACSSEADWTNVKFENSNPSVLVEWTVEKVVPPVSPSTDALTVNLTGSGAHSINLKTAVANWNLGAGTAKATGIDSIDYGDMNDVKAAFVTLDSGTTIKISADGASYINGGGNYVVTLVLNDNSHTRVSLTLRPQAS